MAKIYRVSVAETVYHTTYIEAETEEDAKEAIQELIDNGECEFEDAPDHDISVTDATECESGDHLRDYRGDGNTIAKTNATNYKSIKE